MLVHIHAKDGNVELCLEKTVLFSVMDMLSMKYLKANMKQEKKRTRLEIYIRQSSLYK